MDLDVSDIVIANIYYNILKLYLKCQLITKKSKLKRKQDKCMFSNKKLICQILNRSPTSRRKQT